MRVLHSGVCLVLVAEPAPLLHPGHRMIVPMTHHAHGYSIEVFDEVLEAHPENAVVALHNALNVRLEKLVVTQYMKKGKIT